MTTYHVVQIRSRGTTLDTSLSLIPHIQSIPKHWQFSEKNFWTSSMLHIYYHQHSTPRTNTLRHKSLTCLSRPASLALAFLYTLVTLLSSLTALLSIPRSHHALSFYRVFAHDFPSETFFPYPLRLFNFYSSFTS